MPTFPEMYAVYLRAIRTIHRAEFANTRQPAYARMLQQELETISPLTCKRRTDEQN
jgi:hypothetical protein